MEEMRIEYVNALCLNDDINVPYQIVTPVVRLDAVDQVLAEAVYFAETCNIRLFAAAGERAQAFLASPTIAAFRVRQEEKKNGNV